jgi:hypothetical protein
VEDDDEETSSDEAPDLDDDGAYRALQPAQGPNTAMLLS